MVCEITPLKWGLLRFFYSIVFIVLQLCILILNIIRVANNEVSIRESKPCMQNVMLQTRFQIVF